MGLRSHLVQARRFRNYDIGKGPEGEFVILAGRQRIAMHPPYELIEVTENLTRSRADGQAQDD